MACLIELNICFEVRYEETHSLKENKNADLLEKIRKASIYSPKLITLEVGSRGRPLPCNQDLAISKLT